MVNARENKLPIISTMLESCYDSADNTRICRSAKSRGEPSIPRPRPGRRDIVMFSRDYYFQNVHRCLPSLGQRSLCKRVVGDEMMRR